MTRRVVVILSIVALAVAMALYGAVAEVTLMLIFGWLIYLNRVLKEITLRGDGVAYFLVGLTIFTILLHRIAVWLRREMSDHNAIWRWRSTVHVVGLVIIAFVSGLAMVGITHQLTWVALGDAPLLVPTINGTFGDIMKDPRRSGSNLRELGLNVHNFHDTYRSLPRALRSSPEHSWFTHSSEIGHWITDVDLSIPWDHPENQQSIRRLAPPLLNPSLIPTVLRDVNGYGVSHYAGNTHVFDAPKVKRLSDIGDRADSTLMIGEINANFQPWAKPRTNRDPALGINRSPLGFGGPAGANGAQFLMVDGAVRFISSDIEHGLLTALGTPNGGEPIEADVLNR